MSNDYLSCFLVVAVAVCVRGIERLESLSVLFRWVPPFAIAYALPAALAWLGLIDAQGQGALRVLRSYALPAALILLTYCIDFVSLRRVGVRALALFLCGSLGVALAGPLLYALFVRTSSFDPHAELRPVLCALGASWVGGSLNFVSVAEAMEVRPAVMGQAIAVDVVLSSAWMLVLLFASRLRGSGLSRPSPGVRSALKVHSAVRAEPVEGVKAMSSSNLRACAALVFFSVLTSAGLNAASGFLPAVGNLSPFVYVIVFASVTGIALRAFAHLRLREALSQTWTSRATSLGYLMLYVVLGAVGASVSRGQEVPSLGLFVFGTMWLLTHGFVLLLVAYLLRAPLPLAAVASQANVGGALSASLVGAAFSPQLAAMGILLGTLGYLIGTYTALASAYLFSLCAI